MWRRIKNFYIKPKKVRDVDVEFRRIWINNWNTPEVLSLTTEVRNGMTRRRDNESG